jgi:hypothetical protein
MLDYMLNSHGQCGSGEQRVSAFRSPADVNARRTLTALVGILILLLAGIAFLSRAYGIGATEPGAPGYESVLSQLVGH